MLVEPRDPARGDCPARQLARFVQEVGATRPRVHYEIHVQGVLDVGWQAMKGGGERTGDRSQSGQNRRLPGDRSRFERSRLREMRRKVIRTIGGPVPGGEGP